MGIVLDTSAIVELERSGSDLLPGSESVAEAEVFLPALVIAELWIGVELADSENRREARARKIRALLEATTVLPFDEDVAQAYARLYADLRRAGTPIPANDLAIAALALHHGHDILVSARDEHHFRAVPGLTVRVLGRT